MPIDAFSIISKISDRAISNRFPRSVNSNVDFKPWNGTDSKVSSESEDRYFFMDISCWETDLNTGSSDIVGE